MPVSSLWAEGSGENTSSCFLPGMVVEVQGKWERKEANAKARTDTEKGERRGDTAREVQEEWCCFLKAKRAPQNLNMQVKR